MQGEETGEKWKDEEEREPRRQGRKKKYQEKGSFKHTPLGACQNTLPSSNWVIFDTPYHTVPAY